MTIRRPLGCSFEGRSRYSVTRTRLAVSASEGESESVASESDLAAVEVREGLDLLQRSCLLDAVPATLIEVDPGLPVDLVGREDLGADLALADRLVVPSSLPSSM
jgi:hypothetical protein